MMKIVFAMAKTTKSAPFFHSKKFARYKSVLKRDLLEIMNM